MEPMEDTRIIISMLIILQSYGHGSIRLYTKNIRMSKLTVLSIMEKAVRYQKHWLARALATTLWLDMMKSIMKKNILPSLKHTH